MSGKESAAAASRREKLIAWKANGGGGAASKPAASSGKALAPRNNTRAPNAKPNKAVVETKKAAPPKKNVSTGGENTGALKRPAPPDNDRARVGPGTPIDRLKKRLKAAAAETSAAEGGGSSDTAAIAASAPLANASKVIQKAAAPAVSTQGGKKAPVSSGAGAISKNKPAVAARNSLDPTHMKLMSDLLRTQIEEAETLKKIAGTEAAEELLAVLLQSPTKRGVGEFALYWAARSKLLEDEGDIPAARAMLDQGEGYVSVTAQQLVLSKIAAAFEARAEETAQAEIDGILNSSSSPMAGDVDNVSPIEKDDVATDEANTSITSSSGRDDGSPDNISDGALRYDPNDQSFEEEADEPIKALTYVRTQAPPPQQVIPLITSNVVVVTSTARAHNPFGSPAPVARHAVLDTSAARIPIALSAPLKPVEETAPVPQMSEVLFSDDGEGDSMSDLDEQDSQTTGSSLSSASPARKKVRMAAAVQQSGGKVEEGGSMSQPRRSCAGRKGTPFVERRKSVGEATSSTGSDDDESITTEEASSSSMPPPPVRQMPERAAKPQTSVVEGAKNTKNTKEQTFVEGAGKNTMGPPPSRAVAGVTSAGSVIEIVQRIGADGKRVATPVRRSSRLSGSGDKAKVERKEPTPSPLRREMERMVGL